MSTGPEQLSPAQREAYTRLTQLLPASNVFELRSKTGAGRTTVLRALHGTVGGAFLSVQDFVDAISQRHLLALEEAYCEVIAASLRDHCHVIADDLHLATAVMKGCGFYLRSALRNVPMTVLATHAAAAGKRLIFGNMR